MRASGLWVKASFLSPSYLASSHSARLTRQTRKASFAVWPADIKEPTWFRILLQSPEAPLMLKRFCGVIHAIAVSPFLLSTVAQKKKKKGPCAPSKRYPSAVRCCGFTQLKKTNLGEFAEVRYKKAGNSWNKCERKKGRFYALPNLSPRGELVNKS